MPRPMHFEIHAEDPARAVNFYQSLFGWEFKQWGNPQQEYWLITTGKEGEPGINGGLFKRRGPVPEVAQPVNAYVCTVETDNLDSYINKVKKMNGKIVVEKMAIPGVGWLCYCTDSEGNIFGMTQSDIKAK
ncbi:MAG TPA: VOC family protein [Verrucomicrobiae bacterium]|nr:VOC family protein [Verrucomicrobiae bacterium]